MGKWPSGGGAVLVREYDGAGQPIHVVWEPPRMSPYLSAQDANILDGVRATLWSGDLHIPATREATAWPT